MCNVNCGGAYNVSTTSGSISLFSILMNLSNINSYFISCSSLKTVCTVYSLVLEDLFQTKYLHFLLGAQLSVHLMLFLLGELFLVEMHCELHFLLYNIFISGVYSEPFTYLYSRSDADDLEEEKEM